MRRLCLLAVAALAATGCSSMRAPEDPLEPMSERPRLFIDQPSTLERIGEGVLSVPETALWWPYKVVSSALRGGYDGVAGGVEKAPMPVVGVLASPLTAAAGVVNGAVKGVSRGPAYVGTLRQFGGVLGQPWAQPLPLW